MKRLLLRLSEHLQGVSASYLSAGQIEAFLKDAHHRLEESKDPELVKERARIDACLFSLGWITDRAAEQGMSAKAKRADIEQALTWLRDQKDQKVLNKGVVSLSCGKNLSVLCAAGQPERISANMEDLLRHVEVNRRQCLSDFSAPISEQQKWLERLDISILFSRWAVGHSDLRFLNAAFKLNDFWFPTLKNHREERIFFRYCLSLAEQELSAKELLQ